MGLSPRRSLTGVGIGLGKGPIWLESGKRSGRPRGDILSPRLSHNLAVGRGQA
jgi:hypothetical protein